MMTKKIDFFNYFTLFMYWMSIVTMYYVLQNFLRVKTDEIISLFFFFLQPEHEDR